MASVYWGEGTRAKIVVLHAAHVSLTLFLTLSLPIEKMLKDTNTLSPAELYFFQNNYSNPDLSVFALKGNIQYTGLGTEIHNFAGA